MKTVEQQEKIVGNLEWDGMHKPQIYYAMAATFCGLFLSVLDGTICNVALPSIAAEMNISSADSIWIVNAFQLIIMMTLLPFASLGELFGYKHVYTTGVAIFTAGSLFCALAYTLPLLITARVVQGIGAAMIMSVNTSLIKLIYPKKHLGKGVGLNATIVALASVAGPTLAAAILSIASWPWLFAINVPVGILTFFMARKYMPENPTRVVGRKFNWHEALLNAATFGLFIGCIEAFSHHVAGWEVLIGFVLFLLVGTLYVRNQKNKPYPMLPFDLLRIPVFTMSVITSILSFTAQMSAMVAIPFLLVHSLSYSAVETGMIMTAWPLVIVFVAPVAGMLISKVHPGILGGVGLGVMSVGCFSLAFVSAGNAYLDIIWRLMLCGMGFGFFQSPNNHILLSSAPPHRAGSASGMLATARLVGQTTGAALVALMFDLFGDNAPHKAMLLAGIFTVCGAISSFTRIGLSKPHESFVHGNSGD